ncbi:MAG: hypothetical protein Q8Q39_03660 [bacterium]|nr:hypothetical protein [bacterium]
MRRLFSLIAIFVIGGVGGIFFDRLAIPYLAETRLGERFPALRRTSERTTIVNRTEVVRIEESQAIPDLADRVKNTVVPVEIAKKAKNRSRGGVAPSMLFETGLALTNDGLILVHADPESVATDTAVMIDGDRRIALEYVASDTSTRFTIFRSSERHFTILPFADGAPRLGDRLFAVSATRIGERVTQRFQASMLAALGGEALTLADAVESSAVIVNFAGNVVGMNIVDEDEGVAIISAGELRKITEKLLQ